jgi:dUTP pyrophosphatase
MKVKIKRLTEAATIPKYQTSGASGFDFHSLENLSLRPGKTTLVKTGLSFEIPPGHELQVRPRSGTSLKTKLRISNSPGTIDSDFRGEVCIIIDHIGDMGDPEIKVNKGDRIAQGVIVPVVQGEFQLVDELNESERNNGSFGSTGK